MNKDFQALRSEIMLPTGVPMGMSPHPVRQRTFTFAWDEESTLCFIVGCGGTSVARRCDNNMINGTKLINATGMSRGRRDSILKLELNRQVIKSGPMHLKGVWIPFERALLIAERENIVEDLHPLFYKDIESILYHQSNIMRTQQVVLAAQQRNPRFGTWINGIPGSSKHLHGPADGDVIMPLEPVTLPAQLPWPAHGPVDVERPVAPRNQWRMTYNPYSYPFGYEEAPKNQDHWNGNYQY